MVSLVVQYRLFKIQPSGFFLKSKKKMDKVLESNIKLIKAMQELREDHRGQLQEKEKIIQMKNEIIEEQEKKIR